MLPVTRIALALLVVLSVSACAARRPLTPARPLEPPERHVLPNGVRVVIQEHHRSDVVAVQLWVGAGARDETASEAGLAHYLEHMLFKGTPTRPGRLIDREVEGVGGRMNAGTSLDYTYYHVLLPASHARRAVEMLADISVNASLAPEHLEREKRVVLEEMRRAEDSPFHVVTSRLYELLFEGHPYARPVLGTPAVIQGLTRDALLAFYRRHYGPESFALVVVGAVEPAAIVEAARRVFGALTRSGTGRLPAAPPPAPAMKSAEVHWPGTQAYLGMAWFGPRLDHADAPAVDLLVAILGHGRASRLTQVLRERLGLASSVAAGFAALEAAGAVTVTARLAPADLGSLERGVLAEVDRLRRDGVSETEYGRALTVAEARREFQAEAAEGRARALGHAETIWRVEEELAYLDRLRSVTREQIQVAARRYLDPERYARVVLRPGGRP